MFKERNGTDTSLPRNGSELGFLNTALTFKPTAKFKDGDILA